MFKLAIVPAKSAAYLVSRSNGAANRHLALGLVFG
jgi:hypothetical protein